MVVAITTVQVGVPRDQVRTLRRSCDVSDRRLPPGVIVVTHKKVSGASFVDPGDVPLQVLPVEVQVGSSCSHSDGSARGVIVIPGVRRAGLLELDEAPFQGVLRRHSVHGLRGTVAVRIIAVTDGVCSVRGTGELSSLLPGEGPVIPVVYRVPRVIISDRLAVVLRRLVLPVGIAVNILLRLVLCPGDWIPCLVWIFLRAYEVPAPVITVNDRLVEILVVLPGQLVQVVVMIS